MRVCILGHFQSPPIEGGRRAFAEISDSLSRYVDVKKYDISKFDQIGDARRFSPDILHAVIGPSSLLSLVVLRLWIRLVGAKILLLSAVQFTIRENQLLGPIIRPDIVLVQSEESRIKAENANGIIFLCLMA